MSKVIVVGAGFGGLSAACLLAKQGHEVTVVDKTESCGGRARIWKKKGFSFDMGPSWYLMPEVFERFYNEMGTSAKKELELIRLDPSYRMFFSKDDILDISSNIKKNLALFEKIEPGSSEKFIKYLKVAKYQYDVSMSGFIYKKYDNIFDFFSLKLMIEGARLKFFKSLDSYLKTYFKEEKLRKILAYTMVFLGGSPKNTPALYSLMSHVDFNLGVWYPKGGMNAVAKSMENIAKKHKVKFVYDLEVKKIITKKGKAIGIQTKNGKMYSDLVIINADYAHSELKLLDEKNRSYSEKYWNSRTIAPSAFIIYLGLDKKLESLDHHNLFLEQDWELHFEEIFEDPKWPKAPSYYVCCPSKKDKTVAKEGQENLFILVPVASNLKDTKKIRDEYFKKIISHLEKITREKIKEHILVKRIYAHADFSYDYNSYKGTALGLAHTLNQTAIFRPKHESKKVKNLYYTGQYTHPGIGVPMTLISSKILSEIISKKKRPS